MSDQDDGFPQMRPVGSVARTLRTSARTQSIQQIIASIFAFQGELRRLAPEHKWSGLGNLLGDYGEYVAIEHYGLVKALSGADGYDALTPSGKTVQIKTNHAASQIGFRGQADLMLVVQVALDGSWQEIYYGPFALVEQAARYSARDNKKMIAVVKLRALASAITG